MGRRKRHSGENETDNQQKTPKRVRFDKEVPENDKNNSGNGKKTSETEKQSESVYALQDGVMAMEASVAKFAMSRSRELEAMVKAVQNIGGTTLSFQRLPRHMRRRSMSHDIRRIPRNLRMLAKAELEKREKRGTNKCPSRRHRRRPGNLLSEYQRRQRQNMWLETHIWHAKRFKMTTAWRYRLPLHPSDKSIRACFRAATYQCLIQDVSYECCIEVSGPWQQIVDALSHVTSKDAGLTFAAKMTSTGQRWGKVMMYTCDSYPRGAVGPTTFFWQPQSVQQNGADSGVDGKETEKRVLWLWCHPSSYAEVWTQLVRAFSLKLSDSTSGDHPAVDPEPSDGQCKKTFQISEEDRKSHFPEDGAKMYFGQLCLHSLKDQFIKFRLMGPASNHILKETLQFTDMSSSQETVSSALIVNGQENGTNRWWQNYYASEDKMDQFSKQVACWEHVRKCQSPAELPPRIVLALTVRDPRVLLPAMRSKLTLKNGEEILTGVVTMDQLPVATTVSPIWDSAVRDEVTKTKMSEQQMNNLRSQLLLPGSTVQLGTQESRIPVILLQQPGSQLKSGRDSSAVRAGVASGWDLIVPKGWGMAFWISMVYGGARVGGLRETRSIATRSGMLHFPHDFPDTVAGQLQQEESRDVSLNQYVRRPPAKRVNYQRMGVPAPFHYPWAQLVAEWQDRTDKLLNPSKTLDTVPVDSESELGQKVMGPHVESPVVSPEQKRHHTSGEEKTTGRCIMSDKQAKESICLSHPEIYVLRCQRLLRILQGVVDGVKSKRNSNQKSVNEDRNNGSRLKVLFSQSADKDLVHDHLSSLVPVAVSCCLRGVPAEHTMICLPSDTDLEQLAKDAKFGGPVEPLQPQDKKLQADKTSKKKKTKMTATLSSGVAPESKDSGKEPQKDDKQARSDSKNTLNAKQLTEKKDFMKEPSKLVGGTHRPIVGFLTNGDFDLGQGHGSGIGFCSLAALVSTFNMSLQSKPFLVLLRNPKSQQYRFTKLSILQ